MYCTTGNMLTTHHFVMDLAEHHYTALYLTPRYCSSALYLIEHRTVNDYTSLQCTMLYSTVLYCTALYLNMSHFSALYLITRHCSALHPSTDH